MFFHNTDYGSKQLDLRYIVEKVADMYLVIVLLLFCPDL